MIYVMVTNWFNHWDRLPSGRTKYTYGMLKEGVDRNRLLENAETIFIKLNHASRTPEKAWKGSVNNLEKRSTEISFVVKIDREIPVPPKYQHFKEGWYLDTDVEQERYSSEIPDMDPPLFSTIINARIGHDFEQKVMHLLKIVGFHNVYPFDPSDQAGRPDGFIKFAGLAILYDATLKDNFRLSKQQQIDNYCNMLKSGSVSMGNRKFEVRDSKKQVWLITKGDSSLLLEDRDQIKVLEVSIHDLILLYRKRVQEPIDSEGFESLLLTFYRGYS